VRRAREADDVLDLSAARGRVQMLQDVVIRFRQQLITETIGDVSERHGRS
jgi:hypothetical protein